MLAIDNNVHMVTIGNNKGYPSIIAYVLNQ